MTEDNVTPLKSNSKKTTKKLGKAKKQEKEKPPKLSLGIVEEFLTRFFTSGQIQPLMPKDLRYNYFPVWFHKSDSLSATRMVILNERTGLAQEIDLETLTQMIHHELSRFAIEDHPCQAYCLSSSGVSNFARRLKACGKQLDKWPEPCGFKSQKGFFFERLPFDPVPDATLDQIPFISEMLGRMTNSKAFCQRIGSMFDPNADRKQAVILYGPGDGGKTTFFNLLKSLVGERGFAPITEGIATDSFGLWTLNDKRLWIGEEIPAKFYRSSAFKRLTGDAPLLINPKGEKQYSAELKGMLFANSNEAPSIPNDSGLLNRLILCRVDAIPKGNRLTKVEVLELLNRELPYFVGYCMSLYKGGRIEPEDAGELESAVNDYEANLNYIFEKYFKEDLTADRHNPKVTSKEFTSVWKTITHEEKDLIGNLGRRNFERYILRRTGRDGETFSQSIRLPNTPKNRYIIGIRIIKQPVDNLI